MSIYPEAGGVTAEGLFGGGPGGCVRCFGLRGDERHEYRTSTMVDLDAGEVIEVEMARGARYGPPHLRSSEAIARDHLDGYLIETAGESRRNGKAGHRPLLRCPLPPD